MGKAMKIKVTYPKKSHSEAEVELLLDGFSRAFPEHYEEWVQIEKRPWGTFQEGDIDHIWGDLRTFLCKNTEYDSNSAITSVAADIRMLLQKRVRQQS